VVSRKKILLVDDSETVLMMEQMILRKSYDVVTAKDGSAAVARALAERPDLILLDVIMPAMDGFEACRRLRSEEATRETPIVLVTSRGEVSHREEGFRCGCSDYITKPIDSLELLEKVKSCLGE
jgi:PleD family two-component response regulator